MQPIEKNLQAVFDAAADQYDQSAFLQLEIAKRLLDRTLVVRNSPDSILDLGAGSGILAELLHRIYPQAKITALDISDGMCRVAAEKSGFTCVQGDARKMPFSDWSYRAIYSNLMLQWVPDYPKVFTEVGRVLAPGGFFVMSAFGPDTLAEVRTAWSEVDDYKHVNDFPKMQDIAEHLSQEGFIDVVVSRELITVKYESIRTIFKDLKRVGATNVMAVDKYQGLMTMAKLARFYRAYEKARLEGGSYPVTFEVIYAIAWAKDSVHGQRDVHVVPVDHLRNLMQKFKEGVDQ